MSSVELLNRLLNLLGWVVAVALVYWPMQQFTVDAVRQRLREVRDGVFDAAARGEISFSDMHYQAFREKANVFLHNADKLSVWRFLLLSVAGSRLSDASVREEVVSLKEGPPLIQNAYKQVLLWVGLLIWLRSPVFIVLSALFMLVAPLFVIVGAISASLRESGKQLLRNAKTALYEDAALEVILSRDGKRIC
ncbi:hypothetical protein [Trinickia dinghuensis]|uniref:hypothetical protein n=1 Tax=Trinickia dinghuensis TaxID=2291023 RepID=UPI000E1E59B0|nr:hypothetical protein [Trinickia dinghuensis]